MASDVLEDSVSEMGMASRVSGVVGGGVGGGGTSGHGGRSLVEVVIAAVVHVMDKLSSGEQFGNQLAASENQCRLVLAMCRLLAAVVDIAKDVSSDLKQKLTAKVDALATKTSNSPDIFIQKMVTTLSLR